MINRKEKKNIIKAQQEAFNQYMMQSLERNEKAKSFWYGAKEAFNAILFAVEDRKDNLKDLESHLFDALKNYDI